MDDLIHTLNSLAQELLAEANGIQKQIDNLNPDNAALGEKLRKICKLLSKTIDLLEKKNSPLHRLVELIDSTLLSNAMDRLKEYIAEHEAILVKLRVPSEMIKRVLNALESEASDINNPNALNNPQTLQIEDALEPLRSLRDVICEMAEAAEIVELVSGKEILKEVVKGTIGAATIIVDVTGAMAVPHVTAWIFFKAVKSVWGGANAIRRSVSKIKEIWGGIKRKIADEEKQARVRKHPPRIIIKKKD
jgi:hypothetical protein